MSDGNVNKLKGIEVYRHVIYAIWRPIITTSTDSSILIFSFFITLFFGAFLIIRYLDPSPIYNNLTRETISAREINGDNKSIPTSKDFGQKNVFPLNCSPAKTTGTCPRNYPKNLTVESDASIPWTCPEYFRWIYEDLRPWSKSGITKEMIERSKNVVNFRLVVLNGRAYVVKYRKSFQTRDVFTEWGILQLLRKYPGKVPDLDLMFSCTDHPLIDSDDFSTLNDPPPPPVFSYARHHKSLDILFPDWSFWGWPEVNIKPWEIISKELKEANEKLKWVEREPYAYWKGNPRVASSRKDLLSCNVSDEYDWGARIYRLEWSKERYAGYRQTNLVAQCTHRYKIYIEGITWSVSLKYILACDSLTLLVKPQYHDFFSRGLMPLEHYFPIREFRKCKSIKHAVNWGENHKDQAQVIGKAASDFIQEDLKMDFVYDYMLHLLNEYAKLLRFKPTIPENAIELCLENMACSTLGLEKRFMMDSMVMNPSKTPPCTMPPPYDSMALQLLKKRKANNIKQVKRWEKEYWINQRIHQ